MFRKLRGLWRTLCITVTLLYFYFSWVVAKALINDTAKRMQWRARMLRTAGRTFANILGMNVTYDGSPPPAPSFWICNHLSSLDAIMVLLTVENPIFVARHDVEGWPVIGSITRGINTIFVNRGRFDAMPMVAKQMEAAMQAGYTVVMFPEATTGKGDILLPFKGPLFEPAVRLNVPVYYACFHYSTIPGEPPATEVLSWWRESTFGQHAWAFLQTPRFLARVRYGAAPIQGDNRKVLAKQLQDAVQGLFEPLL